MKIAIIPARGGSKRILKKNIKFFFNKPIISYSIKAAIESGMYDEIMVSTDSEEIASIAKNFGAKVPFIRSQENSSDYSSTVDVLIEVLDYYKSNNLNFNIATCIYPCSPLVNSEILNNSIKIINNELVDCVFPVVKYSHPIERSLKLFKKNIIVPFNSKAKNLRTQDFENYYHDAGMFYTFNVNTLYLKKSLRTNNTYGMIISELHSQDIDNEIDWKLAELKYKLFINEKL
jgi:pseudaminic acid cytidylyltransferase